MAKLTLPIKQSFTVCPDRFSAPGQVHQVVAIATEVSLSWVVESVPERTGVPARQPTGWCRCDGSQFSAEIEMRDYYPVAAALGTDLIATTLTHLS